MGVRKVFQEFSLGIGVTVYKVSLQTKFWLCLKKWWNVLLRLYTFMQLKASMIINTKDIKSKDTENPISDFEHKNLNEKELVI